MLTEAGEQGVEYRNSGDLNDLDNFDSYKTLWTMVEIGDMLERWKGPMCLEMCDNTNDLLRLIRRRGGVDNPPT